MTPFLLAFPVRNLDEMRAFCPGLLGWSIGDSIGNALKFKGFASLGQIFAH